MIKTAFWAGFEKAAGFSVKTLARAASNRFKKRGLNSLADEEHLVKTFTDQRNAAAGVGKILGISDKTSHAALDRGMVASIQKMVPKSGPTRVYGNEPGEAFAKRTEEFFKSPLGQKL